MANVLVQAYRNRFLDREFIDYNFITRITHIPSEQLKRLGVFDGLPYRYDPQGHKEFRMTDAMSALAKAKLTPPDNLHPLYEFSVAQAMNELRIKPESVNALIKSGKLRTHVSEYDNYRKIYRKDLEYYRRNWDPVYLAEFMKVPLRRSMAALIMGIRASTIWRLERTKAITPMPRKKGERVKYSKAEVLRYLHSRKVRVYRKDPLPEYMNSELALVYSGFSTSKFKQLSDVKRLNAEWHTFPDGKKMWVYSKARIDQIREEELAREYYCEGLPYYTRRAIKYKFFKTDRWVDMFIVGKCRRMHDKKRILSPDEKGVSSQGWVKEDVEQVVASGVDFKFRKKQKPLSRVTRKYMRVVAVAKPPVAFSSPVEQMEEAIRLALDEKAEKKKKHMADIREKMNYTMARRNAIRNILTTGASNTPMIPSRNDFLRYATDRQIVTFMISTDGKSGRYREYPHTKEERIFKARPGRNLGRRKIAPVFARAILNVLTTYNRYNFEKIPAWVVLVSSTSMITDPMFHSKLAAVPDNVGAVGPFGYGYILPDGSWDACSETYGSYWVYSEITGENRKVEGLSSTSGSHRVDMLDGPFIAIRGEYLQELTSMRYFMQLGDARGLLAPTVSAIIRRHGIPMMQIPVDCWASAEFEVRPGTPEMNLAIERITRFVSLNEAELNAFLKKKKV